MPTRDQAAAAPGPRFDYEIAERYLGVPPGQVYATATGAPADGAATESRRPDPSRGRRGARAQSLVNPREVNPAARDDVREWVRWRGLTQSAGVS